MSKMVLEASMTPGGRMAFSYEGTVVLVLDEVTSAEVVEATVEQYTKLLVYGTTDVVTWEPSE